MPFLPWNDVKLFDRFGRVKLLGVFVFSELGVEFKLF
jgi:hypothetical protein